VYCELFQLQQTLSFDSRFIIALEEYTRNTSLITVRFGHRDFERFEGVITQVSPTHEEKTTFFS